MADKGCLKRLQKEYHTLCKEPPPQIVARPLPNDILEWYFVLEGSAGTPFEGGYYYGKLKFPPDYPFKPPSISMTTPSGRFAPHKKKCLSMSDFHLESWNPMGSLATSKHSHRAPVIYESGYMKERSSIAVIGLSVHTAPVEMREKLAAVEELWPRAISELTSLNHIEEVVVLSTCNRMEIYVVALSWNFSIREVVDWMSKKSGIPASELREHLFMLCDSDATCHLFEVSAGLDSLVLGEGQILAQVKQVVRSGQNSGGLGKNIDRMFKDAITAGKRVRCETNILSGKELNCFGTFGFRYSTFL